MYSPGDKIGQRFILNEHLPSIGQGTIFACFDSKQNKDYAAKIIECISDLDEKSFNSFKQYIKKMQSFNHPNTIKLYSGGRIKGGVMMILEEYQGVSLFNLVRSKGPVFYDVGIKIISEIIDGLVALQSIGYIHGYLDPYSVLITPEHVIKLFDPMLFTFLPPIKPRDEKTGFAQFAFTSPEHLEKKEIDVKTDIFSLGIVIYYMFTGKTPFEGHSIEEHLSLLHHMNYEAISKSVPDMPREIDIFVSDLLNYDSEKRPQTLEKVQLKYDQLFSDERETIIIEPKTKDKVISSGLGSQKRVKILAYHPKQDWVPEMVLQYKNQMLIMTDIEQLEDDPNHFKICYEFKPMPPNHMFRTSFNYHQDKHNRQKEKESVKNVISHTSKLRKQLLKMTIVVVVLIGLGLVFKAIMNIDSNMNKIEESLKAGLAGRQKEQSQKQITEFEYFPINVEEGLLTDNDYNFTMHSPNVFWTWRIGKLDSSQGIRQYICATTGDEQKFTVTAYTLSLRKISDKFLEEYTNRITEEIANRGNRIYKVLFEPSKIPTRKSYYGTWFEVIGEGNRLRHFVYLVPSTFLYEISQISTGPNEDKEFKKFVESFHFIKQPIPWLTYGLTILFVLVVGVVVSHFYLQFRR